MFDGTRGLRNNNPGNIRKSGDKWDGLSSDSNQTDNSFFVFDESVYGIRALMKILLTYEEKYGLNTIHGIIDRWAPPIENDTASYIRSVARKLGVSIDHEIDVRSQLIPLAAAIIYHENGIMPYSESTLSQAKGMVT